MRVVIKNELTIAKQRRRRKAFTYHSGIRVHTGPLSIAAKRMAIYTYTDARSRPLYRGTQAVWYILGIIEALLAFRFVLRLLGANPAASFTNFIYSITYPFVAPFIAVFHTTQIAGSAFEWTTLLAMIVYWLLAIAIIRLFLMGKPVSRGEAAYKLEQQM